MHRYCSCIGGVFFVIIVKEHELANEVNALKVTIKEIAVMAGVHRATVDKVLHHRPGVSDAVRSKVQRIIDEVGYESNILGKALKYQKQKIVIAAVLLEVDALPEIKRGIESAYQDFKNFNVEIEYYIVKYGEVGEQADILALLAKKECAGVIVSPMYHNLVQDAMKLLKQADIPVVTVNVDSYAQTDRLCFIGQDMEKAGAVAARMMDIFLHHRGKVAIIGSSDELLSVKKRELSFRRHLALQRTDIVLLPSIDTHENPVVAFSESLRVINQYEPNALFVTGGCVQEVCRAVKVSGRTDLVIICFERYPEIEAFLEDGMIDCTISSDLVLQGYESVKTIFEFFMYDRQPKQDAIYMPIGIVLRENL